MKKVFAVFIIIVIVSNNKLILHANSGFNISSIKKIDIKDQIINSEKVNFSIKIPNSWVNYITVESEKVNAKSGIVEKYNFYYVPCNSINKPLLLMSIYVFNKVDWVNLNVSNYKKVTEDKSYVYAISYTTSNPYTNREDQTIFKRLSIEASKTDFIKTEMLVINEPIEVVEKKFNTIIINGKELSSKILYKGKGIAYIPLREACVALGYTIGWNNKEGAITISQKGQVLYSFYPNNPSRNSGYSIIIEDSVSYISYTFFYWSLKANVEVDENYNISIKKDF